MWPSCITQRQGPSQGQCSSPCRCPIAAPYPGLSSNPSPIYSRPSQLQVNVAVDTFFQVVCCKENPKIIKVTLIQLKNILFYYNILSSLCLNGMSPSHTIFHVNIMVWLRIHFSAAFGKPKQYFPNLIKNIVVLISSQPSWSITAAT